MNQVNMEKRIAALVGFYGNGEDGSSPTESQLGLLFTLPEESTVTLFNLYEFPKEACDEDRDQLSAVSVMNKYGHASYTGNGSRKCGNMDWSDAAIGLFSGPEAVISLLEDPEYQAAHQYRKTACKKQKILICTPISEII